MSPTRPPVRLCVRVALAESKFFFGHGTGPASNQMTGHATARQRPARPGLRPTVGPPMGPGQAASPARARGLLRMEILSTISLIITVS
jgi:hypothetical protein